MIYCVWYPSGGFGHFVNAVLTLHGIGFIRPKNQLSFSKNGNSHALDLVVPKYSKDYWPSGIEFLEDKNYCVLVDNGINSETDQFKSNFLNSKIIKICYSDHSWPVVARTMIEKAMNSSIDKQLPTNDWNTSELWAQREKYFLFLRDHNLRHAWRSTDDSALYIEKLYENYDEFFNILNSFAKIEQCEDLWMQWRKSNAVYIDPVMVAKNIVGDVLAKWSTDLTHIKDVWTQAVVYYYIWLKFGIEVPHNDFADFFSNTKQIIELVE
jgi:hypothetical protein